jgi:hypothetical protein
VIPASSEKSLDGMKQRILKYACINTWQSGEEYLMETGSGYRIHPREEWQGLVAAALSSVASKGPATPAEAQRLLQSVKTALNGWKVCTNQRRHGILDTFILSVISGLPRPGAHASSLPPADAPAVKAPPDRNTGAFASISDDTSELYVFCVAPRQCHVAMHLDGASGRWSTARKAANWCIVQGLMWSWSCILTPSSTCQPSSGLKIVSTRWSVICQGGS